MASRRDGCPAPRRWLSLIEFAMQEGWRVTRTAGGHISLVKIGMPTIRSGMSGGERSADHFAHPHLNQSAGAAVKSESDHA
jgi:hypothetical protein